MRERECCNTDSGADSSLPERARATMGLPLLYHRHKNAPRRTLRAGPIVYLLLSFHLTRKEAPLVRTSEYRIYLSPLQNVHLLL